METTLIIGYGNPLRGDDGIGWKVAESLEENFADSRIRVLARQQLTPELAAEVAKVERIVLIDATTRGIGGHVVVEKIDPSDATASIDSHHLNPERLLSCAMQLYGSAPETWLVSISGESFEHRDGLSVNVAAALPKIFSVIHQIIESPICTSTASRKK